MPMAHAAELPAWVTWLQQPLMKKQETSDATNSVMSSVADTSLQELTASVSSLLLSNAE